jgi:PAS domain S-box-containing protein
MAAPAPSYLLRCGVAVGTVVLATLARWLLDGVLGDHLLFLGYYVAVVISAWVGGFGPALLADVLGCLFASFFFLPPRYSLDLWAKANWWGLASFFGLGLAIGLIGRSLRLAQSRSLEHAREALARQKQLEQEIVQRMRSEEAAQQQREWLRVTLASIGDAVITTDIQERITFLNPVAEALSGWPSAEAIGKPLAQVFRVIHEQTHALVENPIAPALREGTAVGAANHTALIGRDGAERPIDHSVSPIRDQEGQTVGVVLVFRDVTERRRAEQALQASERRFRALIEHSWDGISLMDAGGILRFASPSATRILGYPVHELVGRNAFDLMHPDDLRRTLDLLAELLQKPGGTVSADFRYRHQDGAWRWLETVATNLLADPSVQAIVINTRDITERKQSEEQLRSANQTKDEFLATLAHELRNPLVPLRNALYLIGQLNGDDETLDKARAMMERQVQHLVRLVDDLLDVSRIGRGKIELRLQPIDLQSVVANALDTSRPHIEAAGQQLTVTVPRERISLQADPTRLAQVISNLLNNAARYTDTGGRIELSVELASGGCQPPGEAIIRVRDSGIGIPPEMLPRIFDLFTQVDRSLERSRGGLGIGLTLVQQLVALHGGRVEANSPGLGQGSEFVVRLPVARVVAPDPPAPAGEVIASPSGCRILVVDDNRDTAESLAMILQLSGHEVRLAFDGPEAIAAAVANRPDVLLLDISLPGMNGYEVARRLREDHGLTQTVLVAVTGWAQTEDRMRAQEVGFDHHLVKPVEPEALHRLLASLKAPHAAGPEMPSTMQSQPVQI